MGSRKKDHADAAQISCEQLAARKNARSHCSTGIEAMSGTFETLVEGQIKSSLNAATISQQAIVWTKSMTLKISRPTPGEDLTDIRLEVEDKIRNSSGPMTALYLKVYAKAIRAEAYSAGSRETLAQLYRGCPDEAAVMWIGQLLHRQAKLSPTEVAARDKAIAAAHTWATKAGHDFAIGMEPELD
jgi:hypothetical protein